jgi:hypothetical protein
MPCMLSNLFELINKYLKGKCICLLQVSIVFNYESTEHKTVLQIYKNSLDHQLLIELYYICI